MSINKNIQKKYPPGKICNLSGKRGEEFEIVEEGKIKRTRGFLLERNLTLIIEEEGSTEDVVITGYQEGYILARSQTENDVSYRETAEIYTKAIEKWNARREDTPEIAYAQRMRETIQRVQPTLYFREESEREEYKNKEKVFLRILQEKEKKEQCISLLAQLHWRTIKKGEYYTIEQEIPLGKEREAWRDFYRNTEKFSKGFYLGEDKEGFLFLTVFSRPLLLEGVMLKATFTNKKTFKKYPQLNPLEIEEIMLHSLEQIIKDQGEKQIIIPTKDNQEIKMLEGCGYKEKTTMEKGRIIPYYSKVL
ncbi:MAG TPA: hypothetical protein HA360_00820 [Nanoarchaeota archaeon]|nr:hypothetical protein [Nanoarchaeota archaeon]